MDGIADPQTRHGVVCDWLTHDRGIGVFFPKADSGVTEVNAQIDFGITRSIRPSRVRPKRC